MMGAAFGIAGVSTWILSRWRQKKWFRTTGTVESISKDSNGDTVVFLVLTDSNGARRKSAIRGMRTSQIGLGSAVDVMFDPRNPEKLSLAGTRQILFTATVSVLIGVVLLAVAAWAAINT